MCQHPHKLPCTLRCSIEVSAQRRRCCNASDPFLHSRAGLIQRVGYSGSSSQPIALLGHQGALCRINAQPFANASLNLAIRAVLHLHGSLFKLISWVQCSALRWCNKSHCAGQPGSGCLLVRTPLHWAAQKRPAGGERLTRGRSSPAPG